MAALPAVVSRINDHALNEFLPRACRLAVSVRCVDNWAKKGILEKRILPGHTRASGFLESAVSALIHGEGAAQ